RAARPRSRASASAAPPCPRDSRASRPPAAASTRRSSCGPKAREAPAGGDLRSLPASPKSGRIDPRLPSPPGSGQTRPETMAESKSIDTGAAPRAGLQALQSPLDLKRLEPGDLPGICADLRAFLLDSVQKTGGHLGSNLGTVEITTALHYVFDFR